MIRSPSPFSSPPFSPPLLSVFPAIFDRRRPGLCSAFQVDDEEFEQRGIDLGLMDRRGSIFDSAHGIVLPGRSVAVQLLDARDGSGEHDYPLRGGERDADSGHQRGRLSDAHQVAPEHKVAGL
eukprot:2441882-Rhodomonas_salina.1